MRAVVTVVHEKSNAITWFGASIAMWLKLTRIRLQSKTITLPSWWRNLVNVKSRWHNRRSVYQAQSQSVPEQLAMGGGSEPKLGRAQTNSTTVLSVASLLYLIDRHMNRSIINTILVHKATMTSPSSMSPACTKSIATAFKKKRQTYNHTVGWKSARTEGNLPWIYKNFERMFPKAIRRRRPKWPG